MEGDMFPDNNLDEPDPHAYDEEPYDDEQEPEDEDTRLQRLADQAWEDWLDERENEDD